MYPVVNLILFSSSNNFEQEPDNALQEFIPDSRSKPAKLDLPWLQKPLQMYQFKVK